MRLTKDENNQPSASGPYLNLGSLERSISTITDRQQGHHPTLRFHLCQTITHNARTFRRFLAELIAS